MFTLPRNILTFDGQGLRFGETVLLAKTHKHGLSIEENRERILALLSVAYGQTVSPSILDTLKSAASDWNTGNKALATMKLIHLRLPDPGLDEALNNRLGKIAQAFDKNLTLKSLNLGGLGHFNQAEPRIPRGSAGGGEWTNGGSGGVIPVSESSDESASTQIKGHSGLDIDKAVSLLTSQAKRHPSNKCATYVERALHHGGVNIPKGHESAKDKGPDLLSAGFAEVPIDKDYVPQTGDVAVIQPYPGGNPAGHMTMWNGDHWISDFHQTHGLSPYPGPGYIKAHPPYTIYRP